MEPCLRVNRVDDIGEMGHKEKDSVLLRIYNNKMMIQRSNFEDFFRLYLFLTWARNVFLDCLFAMSKINII